MKYGLLLTASAFASDTDTCATDSAIFDYPAMQNGKFKKRDRALFEFRSKQIHLNDTKWVRCGIQNMVCPVACLFWESKLALFANPPEQVTCYHSGWSMIYEIEHNELVDLSLKDFTFNGNFSLDEGAEANEIPCYSGDRCEVTCQFWKNLGHAVLLLTNRTSVCRVSSLTFANADLTPLGTENTPGKYPVTCASGFKKAATAPMVTCKRDGSWEKEGSCDPVYPPHVTRTYLGRKSCTINKAQTLLRSSVDRFKKGDHQDRQEGLRKCYTLMVDKPERYVPVMQQDGTTYKCFGMAPQAYRDWKEDSCWNNSRSWSIEDTRNPKPTDRCKIMSRVASRFGFAHTHYPKLDGKATEDISDVNHAVFQSCVAAVLEPIAVMQWSNGEEKYRCFGMEHKPLKEMQEKRCVIKRRTFYEVKNVALQQDNLLRA